MAEDAGLEARPDPVTALSGVYLAGDWVGSEGWLADASLASAKRAADAALEANATRARLRRCSRSSRPGSRRACRHVKQPLIADLRRTVAIPLAYCARYNSVSFGGA
ncbi:MAG: hypothetical protein IIB22_07415 [Chloroflexi bacterium]|nr:hypothetical protein [Chloroflexota bacterium]